MNTSTVYSPGNRSSSRVFRLGSLVLRVNPDSNVLPSERAVILTRRLSGTEAGSTLVQIAYFQTTGGRRFFRMTPLHHHMELIGWSEPQVVLRLWLFAVAAAMVGVALALAV